MATDEFRRLSAVDRDIARDVSLAQGRDAQHHSAREPFANAQGPAVSFTPEALGEAHHDSAGSDVHGGHHEHEHAHSCFACHGHGPLDQRKALSHTCLTFEPVFNGKYNEERLAKTSYKFLFVMRVIPLIIGVMTAGAGVVVGFVSEYIGDKRCTFVRNLITEGYGWGVAWLAMTGIMVTCALAAGLPVYFGGSTKTAGSSGIPQLIGLLNGINLKGEFDVPHLLTKWWGVTLAVASGLAVGPEGPMIFIGSAVGALMTRLTQNNLLWQRIGYPPAHVPLDVYIRDYVSIGAGCGIAAAFRAPIAGTLFIVEEASSHFKKETMTQIFFGGLASLEVILLTGGFGSVLEYKVETGPTCSSTPWWSIMFFCLLGCICGLLGALFNWINIKVMEVRASYINPKFPMRRIAEITVLCMLSSSAWLAASACFTEHAATTSDIFSNSDGCIKDQWLYQVVSGSTIEHRNGLYAQKSIPKKCLYGVQVDAVLCPQAWSARDSNQYAKKCIDSIATANIETMNKSLKETYCCAFDSIDELKAGLNFQVPGNSNCVLDLGEGIPSLQKAGDESPNVNIVTGSVSGFKEDGDGGGSYNPMASLALVPFKVSCQNLFRRGVPELLSLPAILVFLVLFFLAAAVTAGSAIPTGLLMPQMIIGAAVGRALSLITVQIQAGLKGYPYDYDASFMWTAVFRPFFGEGGCLSHMLLTPETAGYLDPGIGAVVGAAAFLGGSGRITLFTTVMMVEITGDPLMIFPVGFATVFATLVGNVINHGLYHQLLDVQSQPYLPDTWQSDELPPRIKVKDMMPRNDPVVIPVNGGRAGISAAIDGNDYTGFPLVNEEGAVIGITERQFLEELVSQQGEVTPHQLRHVSDMHPITVRKQYPLQLAYLLFKSMDMKNLVVVDDHHRPLAVMTRFAFLAWRVKDRLGEAFHTLHENEEVRRRRARTRAGSGGTTVSMQNVSEQEAAMQGAASEF